MANKQNNGYQNRRCWLWADARRAVIEHARLQTEQARRRRAVRETLEASQRNYQRLRKGENRAEAEPPVTTAERTSRPTPLD